MKYRFLVLFVLLLSGCGGGDGDTVHELKNDNGSSILVGSWEYIYTSSSCTETYTFTSGNTFSIESLDEAAGGTYTDIEVGGSSARHILELTYTSDNGLSDCNGVSDDDTGLVETKYFEIDSDILNFFSSQTSTIVLQAYTKSP